MRQLTKTAVSIAAAQVVVWWSSIALAQTAPAPEAPASAAADSKAPAAPEAAASAAADGKAPPAPAAAASAVGKPPAAAAPVAPAGGKAEPAALETVVISGQRAALRSAQKRKQDADEVVDSVVAEDIGKLPDRSVAEVLQRIVGVSIDRTAARSDPTHYSAEGSGVVIRGLTYVTSQLNGRETFSANGGRSLGFEDVPPELMASVDVYKNPSAEQLEGGLAGLVNLRTALPFDFKGFKASISASQTHGESRGDNKPSLSGLVSNTWDTDLGKFGALVDLAHSKSSSRTDTMTLDPYYLATTSAGKDADNNNLYAVKDGTWLSRGVGWRRQDYDRERQGLYGALQWKKDDLESSLTYFRSKYRYEMNESAVSAIVDPYNATVTDGIYGADGRMLSGVLRSDSVGGIELENAARYNSRNSQTQDLAWNFKFAPNPQWVLNSDLQLVKSKTQSIDSTVATGVQMPKQTLDLHGAIPRLSLDASDLAYLADPSHYYWATTMEHFDKGTATQKAWRGDAKYSFEDSRYLTDVRFGLRIAERDALTTNSNPNFNWSTITHSWQRGWNVNDLAYITNYTDPTVLNRFSNFMGGKVSVPGLYMPAPSVASGYPGSYTNLHQHYFDLCSATHYDWMGTNNGCDFLPGASGSDWALATFDTNPAGRNDQHERTIGTYSQLRFGFDDLPYPVDGNVGMRVVKTDSKANGYTVLNAVAVPTGAAGVAVPPITSFSKAESFTNSYLDALPSLNLKMKVQDDLQFRFAWAKAVSRPPLDQLQAYTTMTLTPELDKTTSPPTVKSVTLSGSALGNPLLKPVQSNQVDLTSEWYFSRTGSLTFAVFNKDLKDIIVNQTFIRQVTDDNGVVQNFIVTGPTNGADGYARGFEVAWHQYFDTLPGWLSGFGMQANFTYVDSKMKRKNGVPSSYCTSGNGAENLNLNVNGCDTDGRSFGDMPLTNLSRNTINLSLLYDKDAISARLAYSWRDKYLYGVALNSDNTGPSQQNGLNTDPASSSVGRNNLPIGLPLWAGSYGQLDAGVQYKVNEQMTLSLDAQNLTNSLYRQYMQQHLGMIQHNTFTSGRSYVASLRYTF